MRLSKKSEHALRALVCMAANPVALHTIPKISASENIPPKFLEQILLTLRRGGILQSRRGAGGGYSLLLPPSRIRLLEVFRLMEGEHEAATPRVARDHPVDFFLGQLEEEFFQRLDSTTIEDLLRLAKESAPATFEI